MNELLFRAWDTLTKKWIAKDFTILGEVTCFDIIGQYLRDNLCGKETTLARLEDVIIQQWTGAYDNTTWEELSEQERDRWTIDGNMPSEWHGKRMYKGDIIKMFVPSRSYQTHYGDNIPQGQYTEPLEPEILEYVNKIIFSNTSFRLSDKNFITRTVSNCLDDVEELFNSITKENIHEFFNSRLEDWNDDLEYLLEKYKLKNEAELLSLFGMKVVGNDCDNPELLNQ